MKKIVLTLLVAVVATFASSAQQGKFALGAEGYYLSGNDMAGLGFVGQYSLNQNWRLAGDLEFYFDDSRTDFNVNVQYVAPIVEKLNVYPLAGLSYAGCCGSLGLNVGGGAEFSLSDKIDLFFEEKISLISSHSTMATTFGVKYKF